MKCVLYVAALGVATGSHDGEDSNQGTTTAAGVGVMTREAGTQTGEGDTQGDSGTIITGGGMMGGDGKAAGSDGGSEAIGGLGATIIVDNSRVEELEASHATLVSTAGILSGN